ncbi:MAG: hypothetical protein RBU21_10400, partial [FCB group bacterium]|nr:hypothetical protein [FCB group bacterium]
IAVTFTNSTNTAVSGVEFEIAGNVERVGSVGPGDTVTRRMRSVPGYDVPQIRSGLQVAYVDAHGVRHDENAQVYMQGMGYRGHINVRYDGSTNLGFTGTATLSIIQYFIDSYNL